MALSLFTLACADNYQVCNEDFHIRGALSFESPAEFEVRAEVCLNEECDVETGFLDREVLQLVDVDARCYLSEFPNNMGEFIAVHFTEGLNDDDSVRIRVSRTDGSVVVAFSQEAFEPGRCGGGLIDY